MTRRPLVAPSLALGALLVAGPLPAQGPQLLGEPTAPVAAPAPAVSTPSAESPSAAQRWFGRSGKLRAAIVQSLDALDLPFPSGGDGAKHWTPLFAGAGEGLLGEPARSNVAGVGEGLLGVPSGSGAAKAREERLGEPAGSGAMRAPAEPGIWRLEVERAYLSAAAAGPTVLDVITRVPFSRKKGNYLNGYHVGRYPTEGSGRSDRYAPPPGFIEVTPENQDFQISEHFRLRQFLTKDQHNVWPKYLVLDPRLIDKLELVLQELNAMGVRADRMHVMSGFRTPQYNGPGGNGRAMLSRHTYGDAADVWVDNDADGYMDDLNGDGRRDMHDARVMLNAVERVEAKHPELVGGAGLYPDNGAHGPFIHIDTRGTRSRW